MAPAATRRKTSPGAKKPKMTKKKMGIILGSVAAALTTAVALGMKKRQIMNFIDTYWSKSDQSNTKNIPVPNDNGSTTSANATTQGSDDEEYKGPGQYGF